MPAIDFAPKTKRVRLRVHKTDLIRHAAETRSQKLDVSIVLTEGDDTMTGMPEWIQVAYESLIKERNLQKYIKFTHNFSNMAIDVFPTPKGRRNFPPIIDSDLQTFQMERVGSSDAPQVALYFSIKFPARKEVFDWTWEQKGMECYATFEQQQRALEMNPKVGEGADDHEEDDDEATPPPLPFDRDAKVAQLAEDRKAQNEKTDAQVQAVAKNFKLTRAK
jgi:hypothetical protein